MSASRAKMSWDEVTVLLCMIVTGLSATTARTIDEIIYEAANSGPRVSDTSIDDNDNVRSAHMLDTPSGNDVLDTSTDDGGNRLVELDLKLTPGQWRVIKDSRDEIPRGRFLRKALRNPATRWPNKTIPYTIQDSFSTTDRKGIYQGMEEWEYYTCLRFKPRSSENNYIKFVNETGCWSYYGMIGGAQKISLENGCAHRMVIAREIGNALGFKHEQARPDRDRYVTIVEENIEKSHIHNFNKDDTLDSHGISYDYGSAMHYGQKYFSKNGLPTIVTKDPYWQTRIGQRERLSNSDLKLAMLVYNCGCTNKHSRCSSWAGMGHCREGHTRRSYMLINCAKACHGC